MGSWPAVDFMSSILKYTSARIAQGRAQPQAEDYPARINQESKSRSVRMTGFLPKSRGLRGYPEWRQETPRRCEGVVDHDATMRALRRFSLPLL